MLSIVIHTTDKGQLSVVWYDLRVEDVSVGRDLLPIADEPRALALANFQEEAKRFARGAKASATRGAYESDWADFERFCRNHALDALPATPQTVAAYIASLARVGPAIPRLRKRRSPEAAGDGAPAAGSNGASGTADAAEFIIDARPASVATIRRRLVSISQRHKARGLASPTAHPAVSEVFKGIAVELKVAQVKKSALTFDLLEIALRYVDANMRGLRDRALLLVAFAGAFRRSEVAAIQVEDLDIRPGGIAVIVRSSKTDQEGQGVRVPLPRQKSRALCPVAALEDWLEQAGIESGPVFRAFSPRGEMKETAMGGRDVAITLQRLVGIAEIDGDFGGHSFRSGFITSGIRKGVPERDLMKISRHRSERVFRGYVEEAELFASESSPLSSIMGSVKRSKG